MTFSELGLIEPIIKAVTELGYETPTPIQAEAIPYVLNNNTDLVGLAQTGTGKTAAFGLPILNSIDLDNRSTQALIIAPTRELGVQIANDLNKFGKYMRGLNIVTVYGGASIMTQIKDISRGAQIIVATPGRMMDLLERGKVKVNEIKFLVLDEADEMLNMGFKEDIDTILKTTPKEKQTLLFSATMPSEVRRIANQYMHEPHEIAVAKQSQSAENIIHQYYEVHERDRYLALKRIIDYNPSIFGIIFCRTRHETQEIAEKLIKDGYNADALHGDLSQAQRDSVMKRYRSRTLQLLVATDVAARGIDVTDVTHVLNYNLPDDVEVYTHRSGRTARAGKHGVSLILVNTREFSRIRQIEKMIGKQFVKGVIPHGFEVCEKQLIHLVNKVHDISVSEEEIAPYLPVANELFAEMSKEDVIKHFLSVEFNRFLEYYRNAVDLNQGAKRTAGDREHGKTLNLSNSGTQRMFINVGTTDGFDDNQLADYIGDVAKIAPSQIRQLSIRDKFSFFNVDAAHADPILTNFKKEKLNNRPIRVDVTEDRGHGGGGGGGERRSGGERQGGGERRSSGTGGTSYRGGSSSGGGSNRSSSSRRDGGGSGYSGGTSSNSASSSTGEKRRKKY